MIYHLLPELEPFSAYKGGAIAHTVGNLVSLDPSRVAVCLSADGTWHSDPGQVIVLPGLLAYSKARGRSHLPLWIATPLLRKIYLPVLSRLQPGDILWCHNRPMFAAALAGPARQRGAKVIYHSHDGLALRESRAAFKSFMPDASVFVSEYLRDYWLDFFPSLNPNYAVHNGADEKLFYPPAHRPESRNEPPTVLFIGRLNPVKGVHVLLDAMKLLQQRGIEAVCRIVGSSFSGGSKPTVYVDELLKSAPTNVNFEAFRNAKEIAEEYRKADIFCCPSIWQEAFGKVNIEAMACATPVVASSVGGIPEIASEGGILLVQPGSVVELADALESLISNLQYRQKVGKEGRASFERRFTWTAIMKQYKVVTDNLQRNHSAPREA